MIHRWYEPHHRKLEDMVSKALKTQGSCLILDCHSFSSFPLDYESDKRAVRPEICIGLDSFHIPSWLKSLALDFFASHQFTVALDRPYSGALVPVPYYQKSKEVCSLMIEVNRSLYMNPMMEKEPGL